MDKITAGVNTEEVGNVYIYTVIAEDGYHEDIGAYVSYGISACADGKEVERISDISDERGTVERLAELCNRESLDVIHLRDVVEDHLIDCL